MVQKHHHHHYTERKEKANDTELLLYERTVRSMPRASPPPSPSAASPSVGGDRGCDRHSYLPVPCAPSPRFHGVPEPTQRKVIDPVLLLLLVPLLLILAVCIPHPSLIPNPRPGFGRHAAAPKQPSNSPAQGKKVRFAVMCHREATKQRRQQAECKVGCRGGLVSGMFFFFFWDEQSHSR